MKKALQKKLVPIYHDAISKMHFEDLAILDEKQREDELYEYWFVRFLDKKGEPEEKRQIRRIYKRDLTKFSDSSLQDKSIGEKRRKK